MKRILVFGLSEYYGGVESFFLNYLLFKENKDLQFDFVPENYDLAKQDQFEKLGCKVYKLCNWRKNPFKYKKEIETILCSNRYDAVYVNALSAYNLLPLKIAKKRGINVRIMHSHNSSAPNNIIKLLIHYYNKKQLNKLTNVKLDCSDLAGKWMFCNDNYVTIPNAVDANKFRFNEEIRKQKRKELDIKDDTFVVGFVGRLSYQKNPLFLIDIFKEVVKRNKEAVLLIVGDGELRQSVREKIEELDIIDNVHLLGNRSDVNKLMQAFDLFLLPSYFEGLAIVLVEAQFSGLKCIVSNTVTTEANISKSVLYLPLEEGPDIWANKILEYKSNDISRMNILNACNGNFDLNCSSGDFFRLINNIIEKFITVKETK